MPTSLDARSYQMAGNRPGSAGMGRQTYGRITVKGTEFKCEILSL